MNEWWTYGPADLVLFTPETYFRLFGLYHSDWWPIQLLCIALAVFILLCLWLKPTWGGRVITILLAGSWAWVGWAFLHLRFATIHWVADWYALAFFVQAMLLFLSGVSRSGVEFESENTVRAGIGIFILLGGLLVMPATAHLAGRGWMPMELFAMTPDATVLATLGSLLLVKYRTVVWSAVIPVAWCFVSGATLWVLEAPEAVILPAGAMLIIVLLFVPLARRG